MSPKHMCWVLEVRIQIVHHNHLHALQLLSTLSANAQVYQIKIGSALKFIYKIWIIEFK